MDLQARFDVPSTVVARRLADETVILDLVNGIYFGLNTVGTRIWELVEQGKTLDEACTVIESEFDVSRQQVESDTLAIAAELASRGLITPR